MNSLHSLRWLVPILSAVAGVCCASALTSSCSMGMGCDCPEPRPIVDGAFKSVEAVVPEGAPASLRDIDVTELVVSDGMVSVHYRRGNEPGTATFTFGSMY